MKRIIGWGVGVVYLVLSVPVFSFASAGRADGHGEIGFWYSVVATFFLIAAIGAFIGTWIHTRERSQATASGAH
jgi:hypothetical protein